ncbi:MAG: hypothetical protein QXW32_04275 [Nitrososphaerales archaeon]
MLNIEAFGVVLKLTPEYLSLNVSEAAVQELKHLTSKYPLLRETLDTLLRWVDSPLILVKDIVEVELQAVPAIPESEHLLKLVLVARYRGGYRTYEINLKPEDAERVASELKKIIQKRF